MNDKQYPQGQGNVTDSEKKSETGAESSNNEESLINLAHSVKSGNKIQFEQTLQSSSVEGSNEGQASAVSSDSQSNEGQNSSIDNGDDQMDEIARKLEDDLRTELQTAFEKPLENNSDEISNERQSDPNLSNGNSLTGDLNSEQTEAGHFPEVKTPSQTGDAETQVTDAVPPQSEDHPDLSSGKSIADQEIGRRAGVMPDIRRNASLSTGQEENSQEPFGDHNDDAGQGISSEIPPKENSRESGLLNDSPRTISGLDSDGETASETGESGEKSVAELEPQMTLPGIDENTHNTAQMLEEPGDAKGAKSDPPIDRIPLLSRADKGVELQQAESKKGLAIAFLGLIAILLFGGAFYAVRSVSPDSSNEEPPIIHADTSPMKILPQTDENNEIRPTNGKIIFDRIGDIYQNGELVENLVEPAESDVTAEISNLVTNEVPDSSAEIAPVRPVRTVVLKPDGTVIEGESELGTTNVATSASTSTEVNRGDQNSTGGDVGNNVVNTEEKPTEGSDQSSSESVISEVEQILEANSSEGGVEDSIASVNNPEENADSTTSTESADSTTSAENRESETELDTEAETESTAQAVDETIGEPAEDEIEDTIVSALGSENLTEVESLVLPRKKPTNLGEERTVVGAVANVPLEIKELKEGTPVVQVSADKSVESARQAYSRIRDRHPQIFNNLSPIIQVGETETGTWYRVQIEMDGYLRAIDFCSYLTSQGIDCVAKRVDG